MNLTDRQRRFVEEYAIDCNAMQAAIRAGYARKTAEKQGYALLRKPAIREAIRAVEHERLEILGVTADKVVTELARLAFSSVRRVVQWDDTGAMPLPSAQLSDDDAAAISEITCTPTDTGAHVRIKMHDKLKALEMLLKHLSASANEEQNEFVQFDDEAVAGIAREFIARTRIIENTHGIRPSAET